MASLAYSTVAQLLANESATAEQLHAASRELRDSFVRSEHLVGLLPGDAPEVMIAGFERAAALGLVDAYLELGRLFDRGAAPWAAYPARDVARSIASYRAADRLGSRAGALGWVRVAYFERDPGAAAEAATRLTKLHAASADDAEVLTMLGFFLHQGYGFSVDPPSAVAFFTAAAERGDAPAAFELSVIYATGEGAAQDVEAGHRWTIRAAELGSNRAQANLGGMYATGNGVEKDAATAVSWYRRAGESGHARAGFIAGVMLLRGDDGLTPDASAAAECFALAEERGFDVDQSLVGMGLQRPS